MSFLVLGGVVAADLRMSTRAASILAMVIGLMHGFLNGAAAGEAAGILGLLGIAIMLFVLLAMGATLVLSLGKVWERMAIRVVGSWVFASGVLMVGSQVQKEAAWHPGVSRRQTPVLGDDLGQAAGVGDPLDYILASRIHPHGSGLADCRPRSHAV